MGKSYYEVINTAHSGATTADTLIKLQLMHSYLQPDIILVYHGTNDFHFASQNSENFKTDYSHSRRHIGSVPYTLFKKLPEWFGYSSLFTLLQGYLTEYRGKGIYNRYTVPDIEYDFKAKDKGYKTFETNLRFINLIARDINAKVVLGTFQYYKKGMERKLEWCKACANQWEEGINKQNDIIRSLARENDNILVAEAANSFIPSYETMKDHCHLTSLGNQFIAKAFLKTIIDDVNNPVVN